MGWLAYIAWVDSQVRRNLGGRYTHCVPETVVQAIINMGPREHLTDY